MPKAFIFHGSLGSPNENWLPWIKTQLEGKGYKVIVPQFPTPEGQTLENWFAVLDQQQPIEEDSILIGHSAGATFVLRALEELDHPVKLACVVGTILGPMNNEFDAMVQSFIEKSFDWERIKSNAQKMIVFHSEDDPYVPFAYGQQVELHLSAEAHFSESAGHFNADAGFGDAFTELLDAIEPYV